MRTRRLLWSVAFRHLLLSACTAVLASYAQASSDDVAAVNVVALTGGNAAENNFLGHIDQMELERLRNKAKTSVGLTKEDATRLVVLDASDQMSDGLLGKYRDGQPLSADESKNLNIYLGAYALQNGVEATKLLLSQGVPPMQGYPYAGSKDMQLVYTQQMSWKDWILGRAASSNEKINSDARIKAGLFLNTAPNESLLPTAQEQSKRYATLDALANSPALATGTFLLGTAIGVSQDKIDAATQVASALSDIGSSFVLPRAGLSPVLGETAAAVKGGVGVNGGVITPGKLIGSTEGLSPAERSFIGEMVSGGKTVEVIPATNAGRTADFFIDGTKVELKTMTNVVNQTSDGLSKSLSSTIMNARGQSGNIIIDARGQAGMRPDIAERGIGRAFGADKDGAIQSITIITKEGSVYVPRKPTSPTPTGDKP